MRFSPASERWRLPGDLERKPNAAALAAERRLHTLDIERGPKAVLLALAVLPEMGYDMFRFLYFFRSLHDAARRRHTSWNHVVRNVSNGAPDLRSPA